MTIPPLIHTVSDLQHLFRSGYSINDKLTEFTFPGTGGWSRFVKHSPGVLTLPPGKCTLTVKGITSGAETKSIVLAPAP